MSTIQEILGRKSIHPFPARMAPTIALEALESANRELRVLDPMAGSGTVLAVARAAGHRALGFDTDPLAVLMARVWTTAIDPELLNMRAQQVLCRAEHQSRRLALQQAYPKHADAETRRFIRFWFDGTARRELTCLAACIGRVRDCRLREALWCGLSRLIITKRGGVSRAMDLSHSRPHRKFDRGPVRPFDQFLRACAVIAGNCPKKGGRSIGPAATMRSGDARKLPVERCSVDLVVTSPPYLNAIDYLRCSKFSLVWMGFTIGEIRSIRGGNVGAERADFDALSRVEASKCLGCCGDVAALPERVRAMLGRYVEDMGKVIKEVSRVIRPKGRAIFVVGDTTVRGVAIRNSRIIQQLAQSSRLRLVSRVTRPIPENRRYLPPPSSADAGTSLQARLRSEVVVTFEASRR